MQEAVRLVVWDLDETFWKGTVTEGGIQAYIQANHDIVIELARRGIMSSICSKNDKAAILPILAEKGILDYFIFPSISWDPKGPRLAQLVETVQLRAPTILFIDDNASNRAEAASMVPGLQVEDENFIARMLDDPRFAGKDDRNLTRLKQYKLLEDRKRDEAQAQGSNEAFLRGCDIRVHIEYDVEAHIDRAVELINRTNQLNYTKKRLPEDPESARRMLRDQIKPFDRVSGLVRVADKYGDYGFIGFFMTGGMRRRVVAGAANTHLVHYCFSCRTLGMLVEAWLYEFLGRPELQVSGEVLTDLSVRREVDWVRLVASNEDYGPVHDKIAPHIVLYGGCEVNAIGAYLQPYTDRLDVYGNYVANGIFVSVNSAARLIDVCDRDGPEIAGELECLGLPPELETGDLFAMAALGAVFVVNFSMDAEGGDRLRHRIHDWHFLLSPNGLGWDALYGLSDAELDGLLRSGRPHFNEEQIALLRRVSLHLQEYYERVPGPGDAAISELMHNIIARVPAGSKLVIISDHDQRRDNRTGEIYRVPKINLYRTLVEEIAATFDYVKVISISDAIDNESEVRGLNHYCREVYLRLSQNIVAAAESAEPRADAPVSKRRIVRQAAERALRVGRVAEARELVQASYEVLLRRNPEPGLIERVAPALAEGRQSNAAYLRNISKSGEFARRWQAIEHQQPPSGTRLIDAISFAVPSELAITALIPNRVLIIGSCLSEVFQTRLRQMPAPCDSDLYFIGSELPELPERPLSDYDFQIVQLPLRFVLPDSAFARLSDRDASGHQVLFDRACEAVRRHFRFAMRWNREHGLLTFVFPFMLPMQNPVGRLLPRNDIRNPVFFIEQLNNVLYQEMEAYSNAYFLDINEILSLHGRRFFQDDLVTAFNHGSVLSNYDAKHDVDRLEPAGNATEFFAERVGETYLAIWRHLNGVYRTIRQVDQVKLVVVDLDDTLWRGVAAELDINNLPATEGWPVGFWEALLILKRRGILLAILSKNEASRVVELWDKIFRRRLSLDDFVIHKINWQPKAENMAEILAHVNLLPRNVLYIDDNPAERASIQAAFPEIRTLGGSPVLWRRILLWSPETQVAAITHESAARTDMVRAQVTREEHRQSMPRDAFLASLKVSMKLFEITDVNHPRFPRVIELVNKTNQFNTTGQRWTQEACVAFFAGGGTVFAFDVADHYTEYGLVGVLLVEGPNIRQFVMSCRVLGLGVEAAAIALVGDIQIKRGATSIFGAMVPTDRNQPCREVYAQCGFAPTEGGWRRAAAPWLEVPAHVVTQVDVAVPADLEMAR